MCTDLQKLNKVMFNSGMTIHQACTLCKHTCAQTHTKCDSGWNELGGRVDKI